MKIITSIVAIALIIITSCELGTESSDRLVSQPRIVVTNGYTISKDSLLTPVSVPILITTTKTAGPLKTISVNSNTHPVLNPKIIRAGIPKVCTPGQDTFSSPTVFKALEKHTEIIPPDIVLVKDASSKEPNPNSFSTFNKLQGLKHGLIKTMVEDKLGNIWLATSGGGFFKYDGRTFTHYNDEKNSKRNFVKCLVLDHFGNIYLGSNDSENLIKFDGNKFHFIKIEDQFGKSGIESLCEDKSGNIWIGTIGNGVFKYDGKSFIKYTQKEGLANNIVSKIFEDHLGNIWFATDGGCSKFDGKIFTNYTVTEGLINNVVRCIIEDNTGSIWFGTDNGVCKFDGMNFTHYTKENGLSDNRIFSILQDKAGVLWFGTSTGGISKLEGSFFTHFTKKEGLSDNGILSILQDRSGNIWFGTNGEGFARYNGKFLNHFTEKEGLSSDRVVSIIQDRKNNLWFGTYGKGVTKFNEQTMSHLTQTEGLVNDFIYCMIEDRAGNIWFGTDGGGACKYDGNSFTYFTKKEGLSNSNVGCIYEDHVGNIWFGTFGGGVCKYDGKNFTYFNEKEGLLNPSIYSICEDNEGNIWFATFDKGVARYDGKTFTYFGEKEGLKNNFILSIIKDNKGNIWFGTYGSGVYKYDGKIFTNYSEKEGLSNDYVYSLLEDKQGNIWVGTRIGLSMYNQDEDRHLSNKEANCSTIFFTNYTYEDGFLGIGCARNALFEDNNGKIWIGSNDRLTVLNVNETNNIAFAKAPNVQLTSLNLFNENIDWQRFDKNKNQNITLGNGVKISQVRFDSLSKWYNLPQNLSLAPDNNYLTFNFIGITMVQPQKVKYQFMLEGIDKNWNAITSRNEAPYGNLPSGYYTFKVKAMNSAGCWSEEFRYSFSIRPPWYRTWWAYMLWIATLSSGIYYLYRFQLNRQLQEAEAVRLKELDTVKTRLYTNITHEFRTPLTIILGMADQMIANPREWFHDGIRLIRRNGQQLLQLVNQLLDLSKLESGTMAVHLKQGDIVQYVRYVFESFHSLATGKRIDLTLKTEVERLNMDYDPEKFQNIMSNLISNAIKYTPEGGKVSVTLSTEGGNLQIAFADTGIGIADDKLPHIFDRFYQVDDSYTRKAEGTGIGLTLTKELVHLLAGTIAVKSTLGQGSTFTVQLPITHNAPFSEVTALEQPKVKITEGVIELSDTYAKSKGMPLVLVVEDNPDVVTYLNICLKDEYQVESAKNGLMGLEKSLDLIPDIIISDVMMPEMDGYELCQKLKSDVRTSHIPVVLLTAKADVDSKIEGLEYGADDYLAKPFQERELKVRLKNLLSVRRQLQDHYRSPEFWQQGDHIEVIELQPTIDDLFLKELKTWIEAHIADTSLDVTKLEKHLGMSRSKMHRKLVALTNMSATEFVRFVRLTKASELLRDDKNKSVSEIAYDVGFTSLSYFDRRFTELFGVSPSAWREEG